MTDAPKPTPRKRPAALDATQRTAHEPRPLYQMAFNTPAMRALREQVKREQR